MPGDSSLVPVYAGEEMTVQDLLTGLMLRSGNDAANATAVLAAGTLDDFVAQMNARAAQLGMVNTHFVNPLAITTTSTTPPPGIWPSSPGKR